MLRVDMHSHTMWSGDCTSTVDELLEVLHQSPVDVLCITDHNAVNGANELRDRLPVRVIVGEEIKANEGEIIGLFLTERVPIGLAATEVAQRIRDQGGVVYIPHPFDPMRKCLTEKVLYRLAEAGLIDAVEGINSKTSLASLNQRGVDFAAEFGLATGAGSDAHVAMAIGSSYAVIDDFGTAGEFLVALQAATAKGGHLIGRHYDPHRPWTSRIVPSTSAL
jgi:predicted metal-dependent phosphoesterase TrpH